MYVSSRFGHCICIHDDDVDVVTVLCELCRISLGQDQGLGGAVATLTCICERRTAPAGQCRSFVADLLRLLSHRLHLHRLRLQVSLGSLAFK